MDPLIAAVTDSDSGPGADVLFLTGTGDARSFILGPANPKKPLRFAVGRPGQRSSVWRLWANRGKDDVYVATRQSAGIFKVSLHESGDWRLEWVGDDHGDVWFTTGEGDEPQGRIIDRWSRPRQVRPDGPMPSRFGCRRWTYRRFLGTQSQVTTRNGSSQLDPKPQPSSA